MGKIGIIIGREYLSRVRNKAFIIMCFVAPLFFAGLFIIPPLLASKGPSVRKVVVVDGTFAHPGCVRFINYPVAFKDTFNIDFDLSCVGYDREDARRLFKDSASHSVLYIPPNFLGACDTADVGALNMKAEVYSSTEPNASHINYLQSVLNSVYRELIFRHDSISEAIIELTKREVYIENNVRGVITKSGIKTMTGFVFAMIIYLYILIFGVQVMRSVVEEKSTRIIEVIISSVRPFQLMAGKIIGVALVALTQFMAWVILSVLIITIFVNKVQEERLDYSKLSQKMTTGVPVETQKDILSFDISEETVAVVNTIYSIPWGVLIPSFIFFFIFGYLMYAALFAAVGSAVDRDADTGQFSLPLTIPMIIAIASSGAILNDPSGSLARWLSLIPFTSPVVILMRIPYGVVTYGELFLSMAILIVSFILMTWLAARIYRVGILMYGKKSGWRELGKWLFYKG